MRDPVVYPIVPYPKPRMTRRDKWNPSPSAVKYWSFAEEVRIRGVKIPPEGAHIVFVMPMPKSWPESRKARMAGAPHVTKPDKDNLEKALLDAVYQSDAHIWDARITKIWGRNGAIIIGKAPPIDLRVFDHVT